ncbi:MAG: hypothetical protein O4861_07140 [Trichodesmium sp. St16_bin4-tuft]|nr:hypothetical protein [Trichodesmium sp. St4_bin8_1]MDE5098121.1 hypothetical protein [Trichodesmium sp. St16_bin4-tuft]
MATKTRYLGRNGRPKSTDEDNLRFMDNSYDLVGEIPTASLLG